LTRKRKVKRIELPTFTKKEGDLVKRTGSIVDVPAIKALLGGLEVPKDLKSLFVNDPHKMSENLNPNISDHTRRLIDIINHKRRLIAGIVEIREKME
jgi:flagellar assembly factor FliW